MQTWCNKNLIFSWPWKKIHFNKVLQSQRRRDKTKVAAWLWQLIINFPPETSLFSLSFTLTAAWTSELSIIMPHLILRNVNSFPVSMFLTMDRAWRENIFHSSKTKQIMSFVGCFQTCLVIPEIRAVYWTVCDGSIEVFTAIPDKNQLLKQASLSPPRSRSRSHLVL